MRGEKERRRRDRLHARAARRIDAGAPARKVCRELGTTEAELTEWRCRRMSQARRIADLERENRQLRDDLADMRCHRRMLLDAFALLCPPMKLNTTSKGDQAPDERGIHGTCIKSGKFVM